METKEQFDYETIKTLAAQLLRAIGEDPNREGLQETPRRFADFWQEFVNYDAGNHATLFDRIDIDQMVVVSGLKVWSMCEHHLMPFWCDISIGYIAKDKILGLSKFGRIAQKHAHRLQIQERLVAEIANEVMQITRSQDVAVVARGEHLCMVMRGIKMSAIMTSSSMNGAFRNEAETRQEFMNLALSDKRAS